LSVNVLSGTTDKIHGAHGCEDMKTMPNDRQLGAICSPALSSLVAAAGDRDQRLFQERRGAGKAAVIANHASRRTTQLYDRARRGEPQ
jgi:hypothetical protein